MKKEGLLSWLPLRKHIMAYGYSYPYFQMLKFEASVATCHGIRFLAFLRISFGDVEVDRLVLYAICKTRMQSTLALNVPFSFSIWEIS